MRGYLDARAAGSATATGPHWPMLFVPERTGMFTVHALTDVSES
jgi:hypothetical protein